MVGYSVYSIFFVVNCGIGWPSGRDARARLLCQLL